MAVGSLTDRLARLGTRGARLVLLGTVALVVVALTAALAARGIDGVEIVATLLVLPVFAAALYAGLMPGLAAGLLATAVYAGLRQPDLETAGVAGVAVLAVSRALAYGVVAHVGSRVGRFVDQLAPAGVRQRAALPVEAPQAPDWHLGPAPPGSSPPAVAPAPVAADPSAEGGWAYATAGGGAATATWASDGSWSADDSPEAWEHQPPSPPEGWPYPAATQDGWQDPADPQDWPEPARSAYGDAAPAADPDDWPEPVSREGWPALAQMQGDWDERAGADGRRRGTPPRGYPPVPPELGERPRAAPAEEQWGEAPSSGQAPMRGVRSLPAVDPETHLASARYLCDRLAFEQSRAAQGSRSYSLVLVQVPDEPLAGLSYRRQITLLRELGHQFVAGGLVDHLVHVPDQVQHWFAAVLPDTDRFGAQVVERRLRDGIGGYLRSRGLALRQLDSACLTTPDDGPAMDAFLETLIQRGDPSAEHALA